MGNPGLPLKHMSVNCGPVFPGSPYSSPSFRSEQARRLLALRELCKAGIDVRPEIDKIRSSNRAWHHWTPHLMGGNGMNGVITLTSRASS